MQWHLAVLKNYVGLSGHVRRKEYWMFVLTNAIVGATISVIQLILGLEFPFPSLIYLVVTIVPVIALCARRLYNIDHSGAWALLYLIPIVGWLFLFVLARLEGNSGSSRYGNDPKSGSD